MLLSPLETLLQRFASQVDNGVHELLLTMHSNGMRLLKLINDLLDLIRLEAGRMEIKSEPMEVADFIKGLASAARQVAEDKKIKLETYTDLRLGVVAADSDKLEKVVLNLLFNALKFTPSGGRVELRAEKQGEELVFIVNDTGIGIAEKNLPFVFDRFWQADSSAQRKYQGVGIGLALVKELAEMMHGTVAVESQEGKGTTFTVRLPYQKAELPPKAGPSANAESGAVASEEWLANLYRRAELFPAMVSLRGAAKPVELGKRGQRPVVLVADDEPDMRRFLRTQLDADYDVLEAADGLQAMEKATQFLPDIILLDMMMPEMDGLDVCRELRKHEETAAVPIILLTARADEETKFNALELGANDFLAKPFSSTELHARIRNLVESHDFQRNLSRQNQALSNTIEQLKETESQLVQSEKLASLGRMSAGIIHEINNPLNFATTGLFALRNKCKHLTPEDRREYEEILGDIEEGMKRVRNIVSDLRMFTHPEAGPSEPVDVAEAVNTSLRFLAGEWKDKVRVELKVVPAQTVLANRNKLIHVLVNLLQNSLDAMRGKEIRERNARDFDPGPDGRRPQPHHRSRQWPGHRTKASGQDFRPVFYHQGRGGRHGAGAEHLPPHRERIRRAHFGKYRGLADSVNLPWISPPGPNRPLNRKLNMENLYDYKKFAILYVDDEEKSLTNFTRAFGEQFRILTATTAQGGLKLLEEHADEVGLLMTDQRMPGEKGVWLLERARQLRPRVIRVLVTAYADMDAAIAAVNSGAIYKYVSKPWDPPQLEQTLKRGLEFFIVQSERDQLLREKMSVLHNMLIADRIVSLGLLAAGLSHHIRNSLVAVKTFLDLAPVKMTEEKTDLQGLRNPDFWKDYHQNVQSQIEKINGLLKDLWTASSNPAAPFTDQVSLYQIVSDAVTIVQGAAVPRRRIELKTGFPIRFPCCAWTSRNSAGCSNCC